MINLATTYALLMYRGCVIYIYGGSEACCMCLALI